MMSEIKKLQTVVLEEDQRFQMLIVDVKKELGQRRFSLTRQNVDLLVELKTTFLVKRKLLANGGEKNDDGNGKNKENKQV